MIISFKIWSRNSNRITFDSFFGLKTVENWLNDSFLYKWAVKCYSIWTLMPSLDSCHHLASLRTPFLVIFTFWILGHPCYHLTKKCGRAGVHFLECKFDDLIVISVKKNTSDRGWDRAIPKSCANRSTLMYDSPPFRPWLVYWPNTKTS